MLLTMLENRSIALLMTFIRWCVYASCSGVSRGTCMESPRACQYLWPAGWRIMWLGGKPASLASGDSSLTRFFLTVITMWMTRMMVRTRTTTPSTEPMTIATHGGPGVSATTIYSQWNSSWITTYRFLIYVSSFVNNSKYTMPNIIIYINNLRRCTWHKMNLNKLILPCHYIRSKVITVGTTPAHHYYSISFTEYAP